VYEIIDRLFYLDRVRIARFYSPLFYFCNVDPIEVRLGSASSSRAAQEANSLMISPPIPIEIRSFIADDIRIMIIAATSSRHVAAIRVVSASTVSRGRFGFRVARSSVLPARVMKIEMVTVRGALSLMPMM